MKRWLTSNLLTKFGSVLAAGALWLYVLATSHVETRKEVEIQVVPPEGYVVANELENSLTFGISIPQAFLKTFRTRKSPPILIDLSDIRRAGWLNYHFANNSQIVEQLRLPIRGRVISVEPSQMRIRLEYAKKKVVPVSVELVGNPPEGYRIISATVNPDRVKIRGPKSAVTLIEDVSTYPIDVSQITQTMEREAAIDLSRYSGVTLQGDEPKVNIRVEPVSANFRIHKVEIRVLSDFKSKAQPETVTVDVRARAELLEDLDNTKVYGEIDLRGKERGRYRAKVAIKAPPEIGIVNIEPNEIGIRLY